MRAPIGERIYRERYLLVKFIREDSCGFPGKLKNRGVFDSVKRGLHGNAIGFLDEDSSCDMSVEMMRPCICCLHITTRDEE
jgi:hypothetical protein